MQAKIYDTPKVHPRRLSRSLVPTGSGAAFPAPTPVPGESVGERYGQG
jgi:hypothetical protein